MIFRLGSSLARKQSPALSGIAMTVPMPVDAIPNKARRIMFTFSQSGTTRPWDTILRISLLAEGLAIMPTESICKYNLRPQDLVQNNINGIINMSVYITVV